MKKTIIIYAHPNKNGFCGKIFSQTIKQLEAQGIDFSIIDLYAIGYNPVMKNEEHYTSGGYKISQENKKFQDMILEAKNLIFIYPTWWQNMPAILKGFMDRVFTARFAFKYKNKMPLGLLKGRNAVVITTSGGPRIFSRFFAGDRAIKVLTKDTLRFCGFKTRSIAVGNAKKLNDKKIQEIQNKVKKAVRFLQ